MLYISALIYHTYKNIIIHILEVIPIKWGKKWFFEPFLTIFGPYIDIFGVIFWDVIISNMRGIKRLI